MPIIFAQAIMFLPVTLVGFFSEEFVANSAFLQALNDWKSIPYNVVFFFLVVIFHICLYSIIGKPTTVCRILKETKFIYTWYQAWKSNSRLY